MAHWKRPFDPDRVISVPVGSRGKCEFPLRRILVPPGEKISLKKDYDPAFSGGFDDKEGALERVAANVARLSEFQARLYAQDVYALLVMFQGMDAAGKDSTIRHVMSGVNPQGCRVTSFKAPSPEELDHDYLWRAVKALPARGMIGIFNRSYYEEVLVVRVHPELLAKQRLPPESLEGIWERRFKEMNDFEKYLVQNGIVVVKYFLNMSKEEQKKRFLARIDDPGRNWKFSTLDFQERRAWDQYQSAYQDMLNNTSTKWAPWLVVPADNKWFARLVVSETICAALEQLGVEFPRVSEERRTELASIRQALLAEG